MNNTQPESMIYFKARQQLLEKDLELKRLKQTMTKANTVKLPLNIYNNLFTN